MLQSVACAAVALAFASGDAAVETFHRAVLAGDVAAAARLVSARPKLVSARDGDGFTSLHLAVARLRMAHDARAASPELAARPPSPGCCAAALWTTYDRRDVMTRIAPPGAAQRSMPSLTTTLDARPMAELLIARGADVNARTRQDGWTPLHLAVRMGHKSVAELLLEHGADVNAADALGVTPLGTAAQTGNVALARVLLDHGASVDRRMARGGFLPVFADDTPLALAAQCDHVGMVELLLDRGANPNLRIKDGFPPLHLTESKQIVELLLAHGADPAARGYHGRTALHQAAMQRRTQLVELFLARGADPNALDDEGNTPLLLALSQPPVSGDVVRALLAHAANVNDAGRVGHPPLHAVLGNAELETLLLDAGASVDARDRHGRTALHLAVEGRQIATIERLLDRGAAINLKDATGHTPLYYTWGGSDADKRIARLLESRGAVR